MEGMLSYIPETPLDIVASFLCWLRQLELTGIRKPIHRSFALADNRYRTCYTLLAAGRQPRGRVRTKTAQFFRRLEYDHDQRRFRRPC
jgi:hypothetical protein